MADEKLYCLIIDENKVVTYKTLSQHLNICPNEAKVMLNDFFNKNEKQYSLKAYYVLIGIQQDKCGSKGFKASVVPCGELETVKLSFLTAPSYHIYCVYKGKEVDKNVLYSIDSSEGENLNLDSMSLIKNPSIKIQPGTTTINHTTSGKVDVKSGGLEKSSDKSQLVDKKELKTSAAKSNSGDIFNLFQKKSEESKKSSSKNESEKLNKSSSSATRNGGTVAKTESTEKSHNKSSIEHLLTNQSAKTNLKNSGTGSSLNSESNVVLNNKPEKSQKKYPKRVKSNFGSLSDDSDTGTSKPKKKHRRILAIEDSDSESESEEVKDMAQRNVFTKNQDADNDENDDDDEIIPPTPPSSNYKTVMKSINTFTTDGEFLVTKKSKQCVTVADEDVTPLKAKVFKEPASKQASLNKKQSSLTSFFKQR